MESESFSPQSAGPAQPVRIRSDVLIGIDPELFADTCEDAALQAGRRVGAAQAQLHAARIMNSISQTVQDVANNFLTAPPRPTDLWPLISATHRRALLEKLAGPHHWSLDPDGTLNLDYQEKPYASAMRFTITLT